MTEIREPYHLSGKPRPTTRIAPTNYAETARPTEAAGANTDRRERVEVRKG